MRPDKMSNLGIEVKLFAKKRVFWIVGVVAVLLGGLVSIPFFNLFHAHEHCMKQTGLALRMYAEDHQGRFPFHTNGFGDAILLLIKEADPYYIHSFTAPGDDGGKLKECLAAGTHMPEAYCSRAYVQGLTMDDNPQIALVFDRYPTRGGDHFRRPWGPPIREVCLLDGSMQIIDEKRWPEFRNQQIQMLVAAGIPASKAGRLYLPAKRDEFR